MNKEFPKEMKITPGGEEACARMRLLLKRAQDTIERALRDDANACMSGDNPYRFLSAAVFVLREMMRPKVGTLAFLTEITNYYCKHEPRLRLMPKNEKPDEAPQAGQKKPEVFHTPKEIIDFVTANPPLNIPPTAEPIDTNAPKLRRGEGHVWYVEPDCVGMARHGNVIQAFAFQDGAGVEVFAKQLFADGKYADCWNVTGTIDCEKAIIATVFGGRNRMNKIAKFIRNGLLAARMRNRHHRLNAKAREDANAGEKEGC
jgi:hypothetical protein